MTEPVPRRPEAGAGAIVWRGDEVLLIQRGKAPRLGQWSIPGGRIEWGETPAEAAVRETAEETGCSIELVGLCGVASALFEDRHIVLIDYTARWLSGEPRAGDDAAAARFVPFGEIAALGMWDETVRMIEDSRRQIQTAPISNLFQGSD
jgi:8-oxo-dGTP diphosphatase